MSSSRFSSPSHPASIENAITIEKPLPETDEESEAFVELLAGWHAAGVDHVIFDFGNPESTEPILRFSEQVIQALR